MTDFRRFLAFVKQGLSLAFLRRPSSRLQLAEFGVFLGSCLLALLAYAVQDYSTTLGPSEFFSDGFHQHASYFLLLLAAAWLASRTLQRPALWLSLASLTVLAGIPWTSLTLWGNEWLADAGRIQQFSWHGLLALAGFTVVFRTAGFLAQSAPPPRRLAASLVFACLVAAPWYWHHNAWFWYPPEGVEAPQTALLDLQPDAPETAAPRSAQFDGEALIYRQPALLAEAIDSLRPQTPGRIDLFTVSFAGDGGQTVFRNEVEYLETLAARRFDEPGRTVTLVNSPATLQNRPMATLTNLRKSLAGVAAHMDTEEDLLLLFLTSHGSEDHRLFVGLDPLPLRAIKPRDLRRALDNAGIKWRVVVVSACFSGGFVDALANRNTLVITASRADRTSFGCGQTSEVTWFGKAFLTQALNQTTDFELAFNLASRQIREWELAEGEVPSVPQMAAGGAISRQLAAWQSKLQAGPAVPFHPAAE